MTQVVSDVPTVVLAYPIESGAACLPGPAHSSWTRAVQALDELIAHVESHPTFDRLLERAVDATRAAARDLLAVAPPPDSATLPAPVPVHSDYFRIRHAPLAPEQGAAQAMLLIFRTLADLRTASLDVNDVCNEIQALALVLELYHAAPLDEALPRADAVEGKWFEPTGGWMDRWFLMHHTYFLLNIHATHQLDCSVRQLEHDSAEAARTLERVAVLVRGFTAGMVHSSALPARYYRDVVRPTMAPPALPINLTGVMQLEHKRYRAALRRLIDALPEPYDQLNERDPALAVARDALLEADLVDMERHVLIAASMVGGDRSLVQRSAKVNATSALREMRHARAAVYAQLMRFGERWITGVSQTPTPTA